MSRKRGDGASSLACEPAFQPASGAKFSHGVEAGTNAGFEAGLLAPRRGLPGAPRLECLRRGVLLSGAMIPLVLLAAASLASGLLAQTMSITDYEPRSTLVVPQHPIGRAK